MPSVGRILRVSIAGVVAAASLGISASSASANDVWLWACHGPNGQPIPSAHKTESTNGLKVTPLAGGCEASAANGPAGWTLEAPTAPSSAARAQVSITLPGNLQARQVKVAHTRRGFDAASGYSLAVNGTALTGQADPIDITPENTVNLTLSCSAPCAGTPAVDIVSVAMLVTDTESPAGRSGWNSPVDHEMAVTPSYSDTGVGLDYAEINVGGRTRTVPFSAAGCKELLEGNGVRDRALDPTVCPNTRSQKLQVWQDTPERDERGFETSKWILDPMRLPEGIYPWTVFVYDAAGNKSVPEPGQVEVWHPVLPSNVQTLSISTASVNEQPGSNPGTQKPGGGVGGAQANQCRSPRLSVVLKSKPVRVAKNVPVLKYKKAYKFTGRLTCVINGKRQSAPKRTKVSILNKVGKKTVRKPNTAIRAKGAVNLKLAFVSDRTVIFRYTNAGGQKSEVKIKVRVTKKKR